jgi:hypothetical protein
MQDPFIRNKWKEIPTESGEYSALGETLMQWYQCAGMLPDPPCTARHFPMLLVSSQTGMPPDPICAPTIDLSFLCGIIVV